LPHFVLIRLVFSLDGALDLTALATKKYTGDYFFQGVFCDPPVLAL
jgi:hypothetical protein